MLIKYIIFIITLFNAIAGFKDTIRVRYETSEADTFREI